MDAILKTIYYSGLSRLGRYRQASLKGQIYYVLAYHNLIKDRSARFPYDLNNVSCDLRGFDEQIGYLTSKFRVISYSALKEELTRKGGKPLMLITFDDGYESFYSLAAPILKKHGATATVFVPVDFIGSGRLFLWDEAVYFSKTLGLKRFYDLFSGYFPVDTELVYHANSRDESSFNKSLLNYLKHQQKALNDGFMSYLRSMHPDVALAAKEECGPVRIMDWDQVRELVGAGFEVGSHTVSHDIMSNQDESELIDELRQSKLRIEAETGRPVLAFCYPYGTLPVSRRPLDAVMREAGYSYACLMREEHNTAETPFFMQRRFSVSLDYSVRKLDCELHLPSAAKCVRAAKKAIRSASHFRDKLKTISIIVSGSVSSGLGEKARPRHLFLSVCDHYEPFWGRAPYALGLKRVKTWVEKLPPVLDAHADSDGRRPSYAFFYPQEEYKREFMDMIGELCFAGYGEVGVHIHHDCDTGESFREKINEFKKRLAFDHGLLSVAVETGEIGYSFIHGNWALDNSGPGGRWCGVNNEIDILLETGCYGDFTMPSAPHSSQARKINSIYYAKDDPLRPRSFDKGVDAAAGRARPEGLLMVQGPLGLRRSKGGLKIENGGISGDNPPSGERVAHWFRNAVSVTGKPEWRFLKLYTHGTQESCMKVFFQDGWMTRFFSSIEELCQKEQCSLHYVSPREMVNVIHAIEDGAVDWDPRLLDYRFVRQGRNA